MSGVDCVAYISFHSCTAIHLSFTLVPVHIRVHKKYFYVCKDSFTVPNHQRKD